MTDAKIDDLPFRVFRVFACAEDAVKAVGSAVGGREAYGYSE